jgi:hypothetical protein
VNAQPNPNNPDTLRDYPKAPKGDPDTTNMTQPGQPSSTPTTTQSRPAGNTGNMAASPNAGGDQTWAPVYLSKGAKDITPGERLFIDSQGGVYTANRKQVGYLSNMSGGRIDKVPVGGDYQIRSARDGGVLGQSRQGMGFDNDRAINLAPQEASKTQ